MSDIEFSEELITYMSQVFWRYIKIETKKIVKDIHKYLDEDWSGDYDEDYDIITRRCDFKTSTCKFEVSFEREREYDDEDEFKKSTITIFIKLKYNDFVYNYGIDLLESFKDDYEKYEKTIYDWLKTSVFKKIIICKHCEKCKITDGEDLCEECFIFWYKHDDVCPVCHEDEGIFVKLEACGHIYHKKCWSRYLMENKFKNIKCMLCRKPGIEYNSGYLLESL